MLMLSGCYPFHSHNSTTTNRSSHRDVARSPGPPRSVSPREGWHHHHQQQQLTSTSDLRTGRLPQSVGVAEPRRGSVNVLSAGARVALLFQQPWLQHIFLAVLGPCQPSFCLLLLALRWRTAAHRRRPWSSVVIVRLVVHKIQPGWAVLAGCFSAEELLK